MEAKDLMLGDWVRYRIGKDKVSMPMQVCLISESEVYPTFEGNEADPLIMTEDELMPIPLSPNILEKNGFIQDMLNGHIFVFDSKPGEVIYYECGPKYGLTIDNQFATIQDLKIKYVHELQHALRLCGIDKEIIL